MKKKKVFKKIYIRLKYYQNSEFNTSHLMSSAINNSQKEIGVYKKCKERRWGEKDPRNLNYWSPLNGDNILIRFC